MVLFIIFAVIALISFILPIFKTREAIKNTVMKIDYKSLFIRLGVYGIVFALSLTAMFLSIYAWMGVTATGYEYFSTILGGLLFAAFAYISLHTALLHFYSKTLSKTLDKWLFRSLVIAFPLMIIFMMVLTNGFADYVNADSPLPIGISFKEGLVSYSPNIAFYAICFLSGALYTYFYCDHRFYKKYGKHGILESTFFVAFPSGIIGARVFYVIAEYEDKFAGRPIANMFDLTQGGITILGGAITGIVVGVLWFLWRHKGKGYSIWWAFDIVLPAILIAQAVGRWGNFFNQEVHGGLVPEAYWEWLPKVVFNNSHFSTHFNGIAPEGYLYAPLFLVESIINLVGFFVLAVICARYLKKVLKPGDLGFGYIVWYGATRAILEPLRYVKDQMDTWSWIWSLCFIACGCLAIAINHLVRDYLDMKKDQENFTSNTYRNHLLASIITGVIGGAAIITGITLMATGTFDDTRLFLDQFNSGLLTLIVGISILFGLIFLIPKTVRSYKARA